MSKQHTGSKALKKTSLKYKELDKNQAVIFAIVAATSFIVVFSGFVLRALFVQQQYQSVVITEKEEALEGLKQSLSNAENLRVEYSAFVSNAQNIIGGFSEGAGEDAGDNGRLILDALPSQYDFPAFITSVEQILLRQDILIDTISGTDQEVEFQSVDGDAPIEIPVGVSFTGNYASVQETIDAFEASIRPFHFSKIGIAGNDDNLIVDLAGYSYFQPGKEFKITNRVVAPQ